MSRTGLRRSDSIVNYLVRNVIQTGCLATIWAIAALATWFWLSRNVMVYRVFDITSGTIYTHVGDSFLRPCLSHSKDGSCRPYLTHFYHAPTYVRI